MTKRTAKKPAPEKKGKRDQNKKKTRKAILKAALKCFEKNGFQFGSGCVNRGGVGGRAAPDNQKSVTHDAPLADHLGHGSPDGKSRRKPWRFDTNQVNEPGL